MLRSRSTLAADPAALFAALFVGFSNGAPAQLPATVAAARQGAPPGPPALVVETLDLVAGAVAQHNRPSEAHQAACADLATRLHSRLQDPEPGAGAVAVLGLCRVWMLGLAGRCPEGLTAVADLAPRIQTLQLPLGQVPGGLSGVAQWLTGMCHDGVFQPAEAVTAYTAASTLLPGLAVVRSDRAAALSDMGRHAEAAADFTAAIELAQGLNAAHWHGRAIAVAALGQHSDAVADCTAALARDPSGLAGAVQFCRGNSLRALGRQHEALQDYTAAVAASKPGSKTSAPYLANRAGCLLALGRATEAAEDFSKSLALDGANAIALYGRGAAQGLRGNHAAALVDFGAALSLEPGNGKYLLARAQAQAALGQTNEALSDCTAACAALPSQAGYRLLGVLLHRAAQFTKAAEAFESALNIPGPPKAQADLLACRAVALSRAGRIAEALREMDAAVSLESSAPRHLSRGLLRMESGDAQGAVNDLSAALALGGLDEAVVREARAAAHARCGNKEAAEVDRIRAAQLRHAKATKTT
eukprot:TRINITY_DN12372_c0_g1_i1.p1 TRINITY_DN12372_c0_g1~~TRINITY_DN12372_c0_g1_i1.p1  ORF type:complete len:531 (+),score=102.22 TRINITY_DN12372_c0_g1_i1:23-1615(+)